MHLEVRMRQGALSRRQAEGKIRAKAKREGAQIKGAIFEADAEWVMDGEFTVGKFPYRIPK